MPFDESDGENGSGSGSDDPGRSSQVLKLMSHREDGNATDPDSVVEGTPQKKFDEQEGQSDDSSMHTPAQPSKRQRLLSVSPAKKGRILVHESDSDGFERDDLFETPTERKRGFKRPRQAWSLVKDWSLSEYDREVVYDEIKAIMEQSLDDAGSKPIAKPKPNSMAGFRIKQASRFTPLFLMANLNTDFLFVILISELCAAWR